MNAQKLKQQMRIKGVTEAHIAKAIGVSRQTICNHLHGRGSFTIDQAADICEILFIDDMTLRADIFLPKPFQE